jgi:hypothetical protein
MLSLAQARRMRGNAGDLLPSTFRAFDDYDIRFRRGQLVLIVAGPGTGKSTLVLNLALLMNVPTMYLSADSNEFTQVSRSYSIAAGVDRERADRYALGEDDDRADLLGRYPIRWSFSASPTEDDIQTSMESYQALYGGYPWLLIVDNVTNVLIDKTDRPSTGLDSLMDFLNDTARQTQACVIGLHHANGPFANGTDPIPLNGVKEQPHRVPQMILTQFRPTDQTIGISPVKNRDAKYDPSGQWYAELAFDPATMRVSDIS